MTMSVSERRCLAIDLGASSGRVIDIRIGDGGVRMKECHRFFHEPSMVQVSGTQRLCWDLDEIVEQVIRGLGSAGGTHVDAIGIDSWGVDYGLLDANGALVAPVTAYRDVRHEATFDAVQDAIGRDRLYEETGIQFQPFNTIYQLAADAIDPSRPLEHTERLLMMPCLVANRLSGSTTGERTNASTSQCFDARTDTWAVDTLGELGIPDAILPEIVQPGRHDPIGHLLPEIAARTGLPATTPLIAVATHDTGSAVVAAPVRSSSEVFISSGTWSPIGVELEERITSPEALACNFTNEAGVFGTNRFLKNVAGLWLLQQSRATWSAAGRAYEWEEMVGMAESAEPFRSIVDPDDRRLVPPGDMPARIQALCRENGEQVPEDDGAVVRCILDSLALRYAECIDEIERVTGNAINSVVIVGGGARNMLLNQVTADITGRPVRTGPVESAALGNGLMQHAALEGIEDRHALRQILPPGVVIDPVDADQGRVEDARARFQRLLGSSGA